MGFFDFLKRKKNTQEKSNTSIATIEETTPSAFDEKENGLAVLLEQLPATFSLDESNLIEIKDSNVLARIDSLVPSVSTAGVSVGNVVKNINAQQGETLYRVVLQKGGQLVDSNNIPGAKRAFTMVGNHISENADLIAVDQVLDKGAVVANAGAAVMGVASMVFIFVGINSFYVDANIMAGNKIIHMPAGKENGFLPMPDESITADIIYICSPNNPTGAVFNYKQLQAWVDYADRINAIILFDAAYEAFIEEEEIPHSIFEVNGAKSCAIEICSLSKTAGFTGTRCGYTVIPKNLVREGMNLNQMWVRNRTTKTNGVSYIIQKGAAAIFTEEGQKQIQENIRVYKQNAACLMEALDKLGIWYCGGKNAPYIWMRCPDGMGSWEFFDYLLKEIQVVGTPGAGFGACGEGYFRFSTFGSQEDTKEAARRLVELL